MSLSTGSEDELDSGKVLVKSLHEVSKLEPLLDFREPLDECLHQLVSKHDVVQQTQIEASSDDEHDEVDDDEALNSSIENELHLYLLYLAGIGGLCLLLEQISRLLDYIAARLTS